MALLKTLKRYKDYGFVTTPVECLKKYSYNNNIFVKLEGYNLNGSIKSRTAYFMFEDILKKGNIYNIVESSSGNLGISLGYFAANLNCNFLCLVDPTVPEPKIKQLREHNIKYKSVSLGKFKDYRSARIAYAKELNEKYNWVWTNQYENRTNSYAHYETTAPELYRQLKGKIDIFVCSVGSGGTISGVSKYLKEKNNNIKVVAVEPYGSTIFGGESCDYLTAGAGLGYPSRLLMRNMQFIDYYVKVEDACAIQTCLKVKFMEGLFLGITSGAVLYVSRYLSELNPHKNIVCISPDNGYLYKDIFTNVNYCNILEKPIIYPIQKNFPNKFYC